MSHERPIRVFTELINTPKRQRSNKANIDKFYLHHSPNRSPLVPNLDLNLYRGNMDINAEDRQIIVTGVGELVLPPDRYSLTIRCKSSKDSLQDAKESVKKRIDYILQTLKNNSLKVGGQMKVDLLWHIYNYLDVGCLIR